MLRPLSLLTLGRTRLPPAVLFLLLSTTTASPDLWSVNIDNGPAPPVAEVAPFSRNASRDRTLLKYQIPGIVGGYVGFVLVLGILLLTVGRRMRRAAQSSRGTSSLEMVTPAHKSLDPSPISPAQSFMKRWGNLGSTSLSEIRKGSSSIKSPPQVHTTATFDAKFLEADKARQQEEMEKLYAAVMEQDVVAPKHLSGRGQELNPAFSPRQSYGRDRSPGGATIPQPQPYTHHYPPELAHLNNTAQALYPPYAPMPSDPSSRTASTIPTTSSALSNHSRAPLVLHTDLASSPTNEYEHIRQASHGSPLRRLGRGSSSLRISTSPSDTGPRLRSTTQAQSPAEFSASPSSPVHARRPTTPYPFSHISRDDDQGERQVTSATDIIHSYSYGDEPLDQPRALPSSAPQRYPTTSPPLPPPTTSALDYATRYQTPTMATATSSMRSLPLRTLSPASTTSPNPTPTPTRTTFLSPRQDRLNHFHTHLSPGRTLHPTGANLPSARLMAAGLTTPYSAYMPFSPVTPVTPGLRSREQRRREEREEERRVPCQEDDGVIPEAEMWGDGW